MAQHTPGQPLECFSIQIVLQKDVERDSMGNVLYEPDGKGGKQVKYRCGFKIGGGIDQDFTKSPYGYKDNGVYVTCVYENGPAAIAGLQMHDKILQVNNHDFTMVTHKKAVEYIKKKPTLNMLIYREGVPNLQGKPSGMAQQQQGGNYQPYPQQQYSPQGFQRQY